MSIAIEPAIYLPGRGGMRLESDYLVTETGGPHVIFGWGNTCVDDLVTAFLVEEKLPPLTETVCEGKVAAEFVTLAPPDATKFESPLEALFSVDNEIYYLPDELLGCGDAHLSRLPIRRYADLSAFRRG
jgi:hypothetical protein